VKEMGGIEQKNGCIYYYGNPAGYINKETAVVDNLFRSEEFEAWIAKRNLTPKWTDGVYDRLSNGVPSQAGEDVTPLKSCRIWQLKPDVDIMMKFIGYEELLERFGEPEPTNYKNVYDGQIETNDLEAIWTMFNVNHPPNYNGHSLSMSDVVELYDHTGSEFHYVDRYGFQQIDFTGQEPEQTSGMKMSL